MQVLLEQGAVPYSKVYSVGSKPGATWPWSFAVSVVIAETVWPSTAGAVSCGSW